MTGHSCAANTAEPRINERIRAREVRLVGPDGSQIGIKPLPEALAIARAQDLDLVEVADKANPPVCRIMDYGKYKYEAAQRAKESRRKHQRRPQGDEVPPEDRRWRLRHQDPQGRPLPRRGAQGQGHDHVPRSRDAHPELGRKILDHVADEVAHQGRVEVYPKLDGRNMTMVLAPDKKAQAAHAASSRPTPMPPKPPRHTSMAKSRPTVPIQNTAPSPETDTDAATSTD